MPSQLVAYLSIRDHWKSSVISRRSSSRHNWFMLEPVVVHDHCGYYRSNVISIHAGDRRITHGKTYL